VRPEFLDAGFPGLVLNTRASGHSFVFLME
jgi:hypothetical protein